MDFTQVILWCIRCKKRVMLADLQDEYNPFIIHNFCLPCRLMDIPSIKHISDIDKSRGIKPIKHRICIHNRKKTICKRCKGGSVCFHVKIRSACIICSPHNFCIHNRKKWICSLCKVTNV